MFKRYLPIFNWLPHYHQRLLGADLLAGLIVTVMKVEIGICFQLTKRKFYLDHFLIFVRLDGLVIIVQMYHPIPFRTRT